MVTQMALQGLGQKKIGALGSDDIALTAVCLPDAGNLNGSKHCTTFSDLL